MRMDRFAPNMGGGASCLFCPIFLTLLFKLITWEGLDRIMAVFAHPSKTEQIRPKPSKTE
jgi:hypothetical protein